MKEYKGRWTGCTVEEVKKGMTLMAKRKNAKMTKKQRHDHAVKMLQARYTKKK